MKNGGFTKKMPKIDYYFSILQNIIIGVFIGLKEYFMLISHWSTKENEFKYFNKKTSTIKWALLKIYRRNIKIQIAQVLSEINQSLN